MTTSTPIALVPGEYVTVQINGCTVQVMAQQDSDGGIFLALAGLGCDLEGEMPGEYYPIAHT